MGRTVHKPRYTIADFQHTTSFVQFFKGIQDKAPAKAALTLSSVALSLCLDDVYAASRIATAAAVILREIDERGRENAGHDEKSD